MTGTIRGVPGGSSAGKTYGILPIEINRCIKHPTRSVSVVSESIPHLEKGAIRDFQQIMKDRLIWDRKRWHDGKHIYTFPNQSWIEFFSADDYGKVHGPRRDVLYVNECNRISWEVYHHLNIRTNQYVWLDFNPAHKFWYHTNLKNDPDFEELVLTYKDNEALPQRVVDELEKMRSKGFMRWDYPGYEYDELNIISEYWANQWRVYGLGLIGKLEGQIFQNWKRVKELPPGKVVYGLDFGYEHDPTALVAVVKYKGELYAKELWYKTGYRSKEFIEFLYLNGVQPTDPIICDHDKTAVRDLQDHGFFALYADKRKGSVNSGIQALQDIQVYTTHDSTHLHEEEDKYFWESKDGIFLNQPVDAYNHGIDGTRYAYDYIKNPIKQHYLSQLKHRRGGSRRVY